MTIGRARRARPSRGSAGMLLRSLGELWAARNRLTRVGPALNARRYLRCATRLGPRITLYGRPAVVNRGRLTIGDRVRLVSTVATLELGVLPGGHLEIGDDVFIN